MCIRDSNGTIPWYLETHPSKQEINRTIFSAQRTRFAGRNVDDTEMFPSELKKDPTYNAFKKDIGIINVFFVDKDTTKYLTANTYALSKVVAKLGGSLSFLMGVSIISVIEIVYWAMFYVSRVLKFRPRKTYWDFTSTTGTGLG